MHLQIPREGNSGHWWGTGRRRAESFSSAEERDLDEKSGYFQSESCPNKSGICNRALVINKINREPMNYNQFKSKFTCKNAYVRECIMNNIHETGFDSSILQWQLQFWFLLIFAVLGSELSLGLTGFGYFQSKPHHLQSEYHQNGIGVTVRRGG